MDENTSKLVNENIAIAFDHLREAIMLVLVGPPTGAIGRLEAFVESGGDTDVLMGAFDLSEYAAEVKRIKEGGGTVEEKAEDISRMMLALTAELVEEEPTTEPLFDKSDFDAPITPREYEEAARELGKILTAPDAVLTPTDVVNIAVEAGAELVTDPDTGLETAALPEVEAGEEEEDGEEDDDFSGLFDDVDEEPPGPVDENEPPAAF